MHAPSLPIDNTSPFERGDRCGGFIVHKTGGGNGESIPGQGKGIEGNDRRRSNIYFYLDAPERVHTSLPDAIWMTEGTCLSRGGCPSTDIRIRPIRGSLHPWFERFEIKDGRDLWTVTGISTKNRPEFAPRALPPSPPPLLPSIEIARIKGSKVAILLARIALQPRRILSSILRKLPLRDAFVRRFTEDSTLPTNASDYHRCDIRLVAFV